MFKNRFTSLIESCDTWVSGVLIIVFSDHILHVYWQENWKQEEVQIPCCSFVIYFLSLLSITYIYSKPFWGIKITSMSDIHKNGCLSIFNGSTNNCSIASSFAYFFYIYIILFWKCVFHGGSLNFSATQKYLCTCTLSLYI